MTIHSCPSSPPLRAGSLAPFEAVACGLALDPCALLRLAGLDPESLEDPVPDAAMAAVLETAAAEAGRADFGLAAAQAWSIADLGPASLAVIHQDTLRDALAALARHRAHLADTMALHLQEDRRGVELQIQLDLPTGEAASQLTDFTLGKALKLCRAILGAGWLPAGARLTRAAPKDASAHRRLLGDALEFDADVDALVLRPADLDARLPRLPDPALRRHAEALLAKLPSTGDGSVSQRAASLIRAGLADGSADLHHVSQALGLNGRTLQRRLKAEGVGFSDLLDRVRGELAQSYLADRSTPMHHIAARLGYADGSAFTRWFTQTFGEAPSRWRDRAQGGPTIPKQRQSA
jgi:AraC-like DNA-binding protein